MTSVTAVPPIMSVETQQEAGAWSKHLKMLGFVTFAILMLFWRDAAAMVDIWWNISTYNHCLLILPIVIWLVHQRRNELQKIMPAVWLPGLLWVGIAALGWLLGDAAGVAFAKQLGLVMMLQGAVITLLGKTVARGLIFPLFYGFFLVPFGEEIIPALQIVTAKMSMTFLDWAGIPAFIDGVFISTPTGYFEVAEACSGVMFLIAMTAYGALVCNVCFQDWKRRALFMLVCIVVPIVANSIRAFGTIYIAHNTTNDFAAGFDHIFYGWFFFAFALIIVMLIGWPFFDRKIDDKMIDGDALAAVSRLNSPKTAVKPMKAIAVVLMVVAAPVAWSAIIASQTAILPKQISLPVVKGWETVPYRPTYEWRPRFDGADHHLLGRYQSKSTGAEVDFAVAVYDRQDEGREIVGHGQGGFDPETSWSWVRNLTAPTNGSAIQITAPGPVVRDIMTFYRIGGVTTGSNTVVKIETLKSRLLGGNPQAVAILVSAEKKTNDGPRTAMDAFVKDLGSMDKLADQMAGLR